MKKYELDPQKTLAILIGISEYKDFEKIKPAANNVNAFAEILADKDVFGIPKKNVHTIIEGASASITSQLLKLTKNVNKNGIETLIFYFAGHGYRKADGTYFLATKDTSKDLVNLNGTTAIAYDTIKKIIKDAKISLSIIFLDACYSGSAVQSENDVIKELDIKGGYTITSSNSTEVSYFDTDEKHTLFTGELLNILKNGLPIDKDKIILSELYAAVKDAVKKKQPKMTPQQLASKEITGDNFYLFKNKQFDTELEDVKEIEKDIKDGDEIIANKSVRVAKRHFKGLLAEVDELKNEQHKIRLKTIIDDKLVIIKNLPTYRPIVEKIVKKQFEQKISQLNKAIVEKEGLIRDLRNDLVVNKKEAENKIKAKGLQIKQLKGDIAQKKSEISSLKKTLRAQDVKVKHLAKTIKDLQLPKKSPVGEAMVFVKGGAYMMGDNEGEDTAKPAHKVNVPDFYIGKYPVTVKEYNEYLIDTGAEIKKKPSNNPVTEVNWMEARAYCKWLSKKTGIDYRLPTESEWEFAARGGVKSKGFEYAGSSDLVMVGWYKDNSEDAPHDVGDLDPNELGIYDMSGNVWEWCVDKWHNDYKGAPDDGSAWVNGSSSFRVLRGGSWSFSAGYCRVSYRNLNSPGLSFNYTGFRLVHSSS